MEMSLIAKTMNLKEKLISIIPYERLCTRTRFETEEKGNLEIKWPITRPKAVVFCDQSEVSFSQTIALMPAIYPLIGGIAKRKSNEVVKEQERPEL